MKFKDIAISEASAEAKVAALAVLLDKELLKLAETVFNTQKLQGPKGEQGLQGPKGEQGDRGFDGAPGLDGVNGSDGRDGEDGKQGVGVQDAHIDFDGSLIIVLTDGREINAGEVVPLDVAEKIKVIGNGGGTSQSVLDAIDAINAVIATYGTMALQNKTAVDIEGGTIDGTSIGGTTPASGVFTTLTASALTATGQTSLGGAAGSEAFRAVTTASAINWVQSQGAATGNQPLLSAQGSDSNISFSLSSKGTGNINFWTNSTSQRQLAVAHTASAVNYVQVTGAATGGTPQISAQGSDTNAGLQISTKGSGTFEVKTNNFTQSQLTVTHTANAVNRYNLTGSAATFAPVFSVTGSDTNISQVFQSKGTGAIDLAAGSSGVNISNGGTVTAITRTASGGPNYTTVPSVTVSAPTTAGGVQATASVTMFVGTATVSAGGSGYTVGDVLTGTGGTFSQAVILTVATLSGSAVATVTITNAGQYTALPSNPVSVTGGTGTGATFTLGWGVNTIVVGTAGSGYVEQPTVTFSSGSAAAYATVGSATVVRGLGSTMSFYTPGGEQVRVQDVANSANYVRFLGAAAGGGPSVDFNGSDATVIGVLTSKGTNSALSFAPNYVQQMRVTSTASAVNYIQVTGNATTGAPTLSTQGSDTNISMQYLAKGTGVHAFQTGSSFNQFRITATNSAVNYLAVTGGIAGAAPVMSATGTDTNIDLTLTPKGTGNVRFGTYTANMALTVQGYIEIKDSGGTVRKLAVIA